MKKTESIVQHRQIIETPLEEIMGDRFGSYSKYIIQDRALPDARDGLKPVQRRILYAMYTDGNRFDKGYRKSAKTVGLVIGNYHPHGDTSVYDAMVRMSQDWKIRSPQIDMQGNNGSIDDDPAAAMRYTEARLSKISEYLLMDIEKDTVSWSLNFDDTDYEPTVLPARYPNLLVNGITGIAAGYATNIPPHNLGEVIDAVIYRIQFPDSSVEELMEYVQGPDFPTGGIVQGKQGIVDAFTTGRGKIMVRSKTEIVQAKTCQQIIITEIPYEVVKSNMVKKIDDVRLNKKIDGIMDVRDESDRNGLRVVVDIKKDADAKLILNYLFKNTDLQVSYNYNVIAIVNKRPMQMGLAQMLDAFIAHREEVVVRRCQFDLKKKQQRCHILDGLIQAISVLDEVIALIRSSKDKADSKNRLMERFSFTEVQAEAIVTMRLYRLSNTDVTQLKEEHDTLEREIQELKEILANDKLLKRLIIKECKEVKKEFPTQRLTRIEAEIEEIVIDKVSMIASEQVMFTLSKDGYAKRVSLRSYNAANDAATGVKEGDRLIGSCEVNTLDHILFFTNRGTYGYLNVYEAEEAKWKDIGSHINNAIRISGEEKLTDAYVLKSFATHAYIITVTKNGMIKKTAVHEYEVSRNNKTMVNMKLADQDEAIASLLAYEGDEILLCSKNGYMTRYPISLIPMTAPKSKGVKAMNLVEDQICSACIYHNDTAQLLVVSDQGAMKRLKMSDIDLTGRPVKGNMICKRVKSKPYQIAYIRLYDLQQEIVINAQDNVQLAMKDISLMNKESTFSQPLGVLQDFYIEQGILYIEQVAMPVETEKTVDFEEINLDL
ncbi:MAG: DNA topoisomerase IV subunit A [Erysipelotrichaceae bacterium]|nr:DNA topoisomerase IV subunit A [Erysipelotrichaceae bacterium]